LRTCYLKTITITPFSDQPGDHYRLELVSGRGPQQADARLVDGELVFDLAPGIQGRLWLNAGQELRLYRVFIDGAPEEDIDWKFYRR
jgi:hypothetical protein